MFAIKGAFRPGGKRGGKRSLTRDAALMALSGALAALTTPVGGLWPLAWLVLTPLFLLLQTGSDAPGVWRRTAGLGAVFGLAYHLVALSWMWSLHPLTWLGLTPPQSVGVVALAWLTCAVMGMLLWAGLTTAYRALAPPNAGWARRALAALVWAALIALYAALNELYAPLTLLAYGQAPSPLMRGLAGACGSWAPVGLSIYALEAVIVWGNVELARIWRCAADASPLSAGRWGLLLLLSAAAPLVTALDAWIASQSSAHDWAWAPVVVVQGNLSIETIRADRALPFVSEAAYLAPLRAARWPRGTLVVLPEEGVVAGWTSLRAPLQNPVLAALATLARERGWRIVTGVATLAPAHGANATRYFNSAAQLSPDGRFQAFHKRRLTPFGETTPRLGGLLPANWLDRIMRTLGAPPYENLFSPGDVDQPLFTNASGERHDAIGPLTCFELIYPELAASRRRAGATALVNVSNLGWFHGDGRLAALFMAIAQFRAAENRLPLIVAANDGPSALVDASGRVWAQAPPKRAAILSTLREGSDREGRPSGLPEGR